MCCRYYCVYSNSLNNKLMSDRIIMAKFIIDDNDLVEQKLFNVLDALGCNDFSKLPDTTELYENDRNFRELCIKMKLAKKT